MNVIDDIKMNVSINDSHDVIINFNNLNNSVLNIKLCGVSLEKNNLEWRVYCYDVGFIYQNNLKTFIDNLRLLKNTRLTISDQDGCIEFEYINGQFLFRMDMYAMTTTHNLSSNNENISQFCDQFDTLYNHLCKSYENCDYKTSQCYDSKFKLCDIQHYQVLQLNN